MKAPTINVFRLGFTVGWLSFMTNQDFHSPHEVFSALTADFIRGVALQA